MDQRGPTLPSMDHEHPRLALDLAQPTAGLRATPTTECTPCLGMPMVSSGKTPSRVPKGCSPQSTAGDAPASCRRPARAGPCARPTCAAPRTAAPRHRRGRTCPDHGAGTGAGNAPGRFAGRAAARCSARQPAHRLLPTRTPALQTASDVCGSAQTAATTAVTPHVQLYPAGRSPVSSVVEPFPPVPTGGVPAKPQVLQGPRTGSRQPPRARMIAPIHPQGQTLDPDGPQVQRWPHRADGMRTEEAWSTPGIDRKHDTGSRPCTSC